MNGRNSARPPANIECTVLMHADECILTRIAICASACWTLEQFVASGDMSSRQVWSNSYLRAASEAATRYGLPLR